MGSKFQNSQGCNTVRPYLKERERKGRKEGRKNERERKRKAQEKSRSLGIRNQPDNLGLFFLV